MDVGALQSSMNATAELAQTVLSGPLQEQNAAMKMAGVGIQMQLEAQQTAQAQATVAEMTGVGAKLNTYA